VANINGFTVLVEDLKYPYAQSISVCCQCICSVNIPLVLTTGSFYFVMVISLSRRMTVAGRCVSIYSGVMIMLPKVLQMLSVLRNEATLVFTNISSIYM